MAILGLLQDQPDTPSLQLSFIIFWMRACYNYKLCRSISYNTIYALSGKSFRVFVETKEEVEWHFVFAQNSLMLSITFVNVGFSRKPGINICIEFHVESCSKMRPFKMILLVGMELCVQHNTFGALGWKKAKSTLGKYIHEAKRKRSAKGFFRGKRTSVRPSFSRNNSWPCSYYVAARSLLLKKNTDIYPNTVLYVKELTLKGSVCLTTKIIEQ